MKKSRKPKPTAQRKPRRPQVDYRNVERGKAELERMIAESERKDGERREEK